jgi:hypothetical protein
MLRLVTAMALSFALCAQPPCASCHPAQSAAHAASNHARTLRPVSQTEFARALPDRPIAEARDGFLLHYTADGDRLLVRAARGAETASGLIAWVIGAGDQGLTPLLALNGSLLEHRISFYTKPGRFDLTLGHRPGPSSSAAAALGVPQPESTARACLGCHGRIDPAELRITEAGVGCDRCHAGASAHAASLGPVTHPGRMKAADQVRLCAECHRLTPPGNAADPLNIRFQPLRLVLSRCYQQGGAACAGCHPAHRNAVRDDPAFYRQQCAQCHQSSHARESSDCLPCHMPKSSPAPYLSFTDHFIRIPAKIRSR